MKKTTYSECGGQPRSSERRGERATNRHDDDERERQFRDESLAVHARDVRCGGGYLIRRKKIGGD